MAAPKFDKDMLKKHHFWLLFAPLLIFLLIAWFLLLDDVPDTITTIQANTDKAVKTVKSAPPAKPKAALTEYDKQLADVGVKNRDMWKHGWEMQKDLFVWPEGYPDQWRAYVKDLGFGDAIPERPEGILDQFRSPESYANEYKNLVKAIEPIQFKDRWERALRYKEVWERVPDSEDVWLAMEDLWVQRQLLLAIDRVNRDAARFTRVAAATDDPMHRQFQSRFWEIDLQVVTNKDNKQIVKWKLKNISGRLQVMGVGNIMKLRVMLSGQAFPLEAEGEPVEADGLVEEKKLDESKYVVKKGRVTEIESVEQIFDARTAPVKRIESIALGKLSDRYKALPLRMSAFSKIAADKELKDQKEPKVGDPMTPMPMGDMAPMEGADDSTPAEVEAKNLPPLSRNRFERNRYIVRTDQIRRMPFGVVVTVDQTFMKDVEEALINLKLRVQITQVTWVRFHDTLDYQAAGAAADGKGPSNNRDDQFSANLLELSLYGIVTLYEKLPSEGPKAPGPKTPPAKKS
jgi:hypothetical protein